MTQPIVVGVDGSGRSLRALVWAARDAELRGCGLRLIHTLPRYEGDIPFYAPGRIEKEEERSREIMAEAHAIVHETFPDLEVTDDQPRKSPAHALRDESENAAAVVIGAKGEDLGNLLLGSATLQLVGHARCPVVVVGHVAAGHGIVAVGTDGSDNARAALAFAFEEAQLRGARLRVIRALGRPDDLPSHLIDTRRDVIDPAEIERLEEELAPLREEYPDVEVLPDIRHAGAIHAMAHASQKADLLVMGSRGKGGFHGLAMGSVSHKLLHFASCPVAIIHA